MRKAGLVLAVVAGVAGAAAAQVAAGRLTVAVTANGEPAVGRVDVLPPGGGAAVATGAAAAVLEVPPGTYDVKVTLTDAIDDPARTKDAVTVASGAEVAVAVDFEVARVTLVCRRGETDLAGDVRLRRPGTSSWLPAVRCGEAFLVSGGTYEAEVSIAGVAQVVRLPRLQFMSGATQRLPVPVP